ncbi:uncharacterized protein LOC130933952 [Arachis stenosperma]|uniref:uncharacterized protein LOC130933952 n=1 Tax=Arachis stenosperma TaxID=217475 RepID=UPI0025ACAE9D|nr:uncharacterized protein LOC130933952 [Arachis stenosperma]
MKKNDERIKGTACCGTWEGERSRTGRKRLGGGGGGVRRSGGHGGAEGQFGQGEREGMGGWGKWGGCCWLRGVVVDGGGGVWGHGGGSGGGGGGKKREKERREEERGRVGCGSVWVVGGVRVVSVVAGWWRRRIEKGERGKGVEFVVDGNSLGMGVSSGFILHIRPWGSVEGLNIRKIIALTSPPLLVPVDEGLQCTVSLILRG